MYTLTYWSVLIFLDVIWWGGFTYDLGNLLGTSKRMAAWLFFGAGALITSSIYVMRLGKMLRIAGESLSDEHVLLSRSRIPNELSDFTLRLQEFKRFIRTNEEARRLAEQQKADLIVYLAHDLKTPLTSVIGYLSLLNEAPDIPTEQRAKYTGIALEKAYRLEQLINEFFEVTRMNLQPSALPKVPFDLSVLLLQVINEFYPMLEEKNMKVDTNIAPSMLLNGDPDKLARVFENLLRNAVNYGLENSQIGCAMYTDQKNAIIRISNTGNTIPVEKLTRLFDKFYRLDESRTSTTGGTGLGLAIAKQIVELHGGTIGVTSINNITEFTVVLPL